MLLRTKPKPFVAQVTAEARELKAHVDAIVVHTAEPVNIASAEVAQLRRARVRYARTCDALEREHDLLLRAGDLARVRAREWVAHQGELQRNAEREANLAEEQVFVLRGRYDALCFETKKKT